MSTRPEYVDFDSKSRDELLSQIGTFDPAERTIFGRLCEAWQPRMDAQRFLGTVSAADQESAALRRLMTKLRTAQLGLLTTKATVNGVMPDSIILTSRGSIDFWRELIKEETIFSSPEAILTLPSESRLAERRLMPPGYLITDIDSTTLAQTHSGRGDESQIHRLRLLDDYRIIFAAESTHLLVNQAFSTLRRDIEERGILEELARLRNTSLTEMRAQLKSKSPDAWLENTRTLVKERATVAYRKNIEPVDELFQMAYLVMSFVDARMGLARQSQEDHEAVDAQIKELAREVAAAPRGTMDQQTFEQLMTKAEEKLGAHSRAFRSQLDEQVFTPRKRRTLPVVSLIHGLYVHQDRLASLFEGTLTEARGRLMEEYAELLEAFLRGRDSDITEILGSRARLDSDIRERIDRIHPLLAEILARPQALAEAMVREARRKGTADSLEELKVALSGYFQVEDSKLKPLQDILGIDIPAAFDRAYERLSVFRQLLLRITGKHESLRSSYEKRFATTHHRTRYTDALPDPASPSATRNAMSGGNAGNSSGSRSGARARSKYRSAKAKAPAKPKAKSAQEIEDLWKEFGDAITHKHQE